MGIRNWSLCIKQTTNLKIAEYFLKKWEFIATITSQRYLSTFCPTTKLRISAMFHFICTLYSTLFQVNKDLFYQRITRIHKYFTAGEFVLGTLHWLELFPHKVDLTKSVVDIFGDEFDFFISAMTKVPGTSFKSVCSNNTCSKPKLLSKSSEIYTSVSGVL